MSILNTNIELWKPVKNYEGLYEVSTLGRVKRLAHHRIHWVNKTVSRFSEKILKSSPNNHNVCNVKLYKNRKGKTFSVHRLVAVAFLSIKDNKDVVNHIDGNRLNNKVSNLEWVNPRENKTHSYIGVATSSKFTGVHFRPDLNKKWVASYTIGTKTYHIGCFNSEKLAHRAYNLKLKKMGYTNKYSTDNNLKIALPK